MDHKSHIRGTLFLLISSLVFMVSGYFINVILARHLGPETYGKYGVLIALVTVFNLIQSAGLPQALSRFVAESKSKNTTSLLLIASKRIQLLSTLGTSLIFFIAAKPVALFLGDESLTSNLQILAAVFPIYGFFALFGGYFNGSHNYLKQAAMNAIYSFMKFVGVVLLALKFGLPGAMIGFVVAPLLPLAYGYVRSSKAATADKLPYAPLINYSLPLIAFAIFSTVQLNADLFVLKRLVPEGPFVGYYAVAQSISSLLFFGLSAIGMAAYPAVAKLYKHGSLSQASQLSGHTIKFLYFLLIPMLALISAESLGIIQILFSSDYVLGAGALSILVIAYSFLTLFALIANIFNAIGRVKIAVITAAMGVLIDILACYLLVPKYGMIGAAYSALISSVIICIASGLMLQRIIKFLPSARSIFIPLCLSALIYTVAVNIKLTGVLLILQLVLEFSFYIGALVTLKELQKADLVKLKASFKKNA